MKTKTPIHAGPPVIKTSTTDFVHSAQAANRVGPRWLNIVKSIFGPPSQRRLGYAALQVDKVRYWEKEFEGLTDADIKVRGQQLRGRARGGESLTSLLPEVYGLICVACKRQLGLRPFDVQIAAGVVLHHCAFAELATGEGKTLVAILPVTLNALVGKGAHVTTVNDYLARRDGEWTGTVYNALGLSVGILQEEMGDGDRVAAYRADITYGTAAQFGFDFLRDRLKVSGTANTAVPFWQAWSTGAQAQRPLDPKVQRGHHFVLVDEADNIFIDEAKTPLIIASPTRLATEEETIVYRWANILAPKMQLDVHFTYDMKKQKIELTDEGRQMIRWSNPPSGPHSHAMDKLAEHVERGLQAHHRFKRDQHYMIDDEEVILIDESTGRSMPDRQWREGLHQAVEAKEGVPITHASDHAAQITFQRYFRLYERLCGMSGTAIDNYWELRRVYKLWVVQVPRNRPVIRKDLPDKVYGTQDAKFEAVAQEIRRLNEIGRPVLVGTRTVEASEVLSARLKEFNIRHEVLNAKPENADREADIVAQAGRYKAVTIATNMAGRGTDIILGGNPETMAWAQLKDRYNMRSDVPREMWHDLVEKIRAEENMAEERRLVLNAGGLHVLGTERHEARRIDRQLAGRAGRQGDPGSSQFIVSLDDDLLEGLGQRKQERLKERGEADPDASWDSYLPLFMTAQRRIEKRHKRQRVDLMLYEKNRQDILKDIGADPYVD
ncbi:MAG TPA: preprotein translocase subunit SecA [Gemmataceae bacterium]|nr:preprotein translocase subunit SecA [Gemmataceae bacterium]